MRRGPRYADAALLVTICDVGPRDGLQNEQVVLEPPARAELVDRLVGSAYAALEAGATVFEASVGGLGGCPFAPRCSNAIAVCTEQRPSLEPIEPDQRAACFNPVPIDAWERSKLEGVA